MSRDVQLSPNNLDAPHLISAIRAPSIATKDISSLTTKPQENMTPRPGCTLTSEQAVNQRRWNNISSVADLKYITLAVTESTSTHFAVSSDIWNSHLNASKLWKYSSPCLNQIRSVCSLSRTAMFDNAVCRRRKIKTHNSQCCQTSVWLQWTEDALCLQI